MVLCPAGMVGVGVHNKKFRRNERQPKKFNKILAILQFQMFHVCLA